MSIVEVRCPRCGAPSRLRSDRTDEYVCSHCGALFHFIDPSQQILTTDVRIRNCLHCGNPIQAGMGFECTRCGKKYFCSSCVDKVKEKNVCFECIATSKENCQSCSKYAVYRCASCGRRACSKHGLYVGFVEKRVFWDGRFNREQDFVFYCQTCVSFICRACVKRKFLTNNAYCPKCSTVLNEYAPYS